jgi:hypothetical protein
MSERYGEAVARNLFVEMRQISRQATAGNHVGGGIQILTRVIRNDRVAYAAV